MTALKFLLVMLGIGIFGSAGALVVYDVVVATQVRRLLGRSASSRSMCTGDSSSNRSLRGSAPVPVRWRRTATPV